MHVREVFIGMRESRCTLVPRGRLLRLPEHWPELRGAAQAFESGAKPFRIGRVLFLHQKAQVHNIANQTRANDSRTELVVANPSPWHQGSFLPDALPPSGHHI